MRRNKGEGGGGEEIDRIPDRTQEWIIRVIRESTARDLQYDNATIAKISWKAMSYVLSPSANAPELRQNREYICNVFTASARQVT